MLHRVRELFELELSQMDWSSGVSKQRILEHFRMAPTLREALESSLPDKKFRSADELLQAIPQGAWDRIEQTVQHGSPESHYLQSRAAQFNIGGQTPGFGHTTEQPPHQPGY